MNTVAAKAFEVLLVDDNPGDVCAVRESLKEAHPTARLNVAKDGVDAIRFLRREGECVSAPRPDLLLLDLRLPRRSGFDVLREIKNDPGLASIPVVIQSSSASSADVNRAYRMHANSYITKSRDLDEFGRTMRALFGFWGATAKLPGKDYPEAQ
jgi:chemotaxis family two-component system response regulator Rcp1